MRSKFTPESWARLQNHLHKSPVGCCTTLLVKHTSTHGDQQTPAPGPILGTPAPLKENKELVPSTKTAKIQARCGVGLQLLQIFTYQKKKKKSCASRNDKGCFPTPAPESPWVPLTALAPKGSAHLFNHLGQRLPSHHGLAKGLPALRKGNLMSAPTQRCGSSFQRKRQKGLHPRKKKRHFVVSKSPHFNQREYKFLCAQTSTIVFKKENKKERGEKSPRHIPRQPFVGLSWLLGHGSGQRLQGVFKFGKNQSWMESLHQRLRKAGEQVAPAVGSRAEIHSTRIPCGDWDLPASQPLWLYPQRQREIEKKIFSHLLQSDQPFCGEEGRGSV